MKKRLNRMLVSIAVLAILFTTLLITIVYHDLYEKQVMEELHTVSRLLKYYAETEIEDVVDSAVFTEESGQFSDRILTDELRVTIVNTLGKVLYDSHADSVTMDNHGLRPEIVQAYAEGEGRSVRHSETLAENTYYYAVVLSDGNVLRISKEAGSIFSIFVSAIPSLVLVIVILIIVCMSIAHFMTAKLIAPIDRLAENWDNAKEVADYMELQPFIDTIRDQHENIMKNAKMRQEFTANVSHELKTPLTSISGYAELIETGMASEADVTRFAHGIRKSSNRLLTLINDIIRLSELDGREEQMVTERVNLYALAETCVDMLGMNAEKHKVHIMLEGEEAYVNGNRQMLEEVLYNLCDNAIRYNNEDGSVLVSVKNSEEGVMLRVKDTGIGIPKEHQERIFERFYRVDKSRSKSTGGTGLGLAIVKHIISKHEARMELHSEPGKGTEYCIVFFDKASVS